MIDINYNYSIIQSIIFYLHRRILRYGNSTLKYFEITTHKQILVFIVRAIKITLPTPLIDTTSHGMCIMQIHISNYHLHTWTKRDYQQQHPRQQHPRLLNAFIKPTQNRRHLEVANCAHNSRVARAGVSSFTRLKTESRNYKLFQPYEVALCVGTC